MTQTQIETPVLVGDLCSTESILDKIQELTLAEKIELMQFIDRRFPES